MNDTLLRLARLLPLLAILLVGPADANDKDSAKKKPVKKEESSLWMKKKLEYSKGILDGLTKADYDGIKKNAEALKVIKYLSEWDHGNKAEYRRQTKYFEDAVKDLIKQADKKNINGATLAYTQLTLSCVHCHNVVRDTKKK